MKKILVICTIVLCVALSSGYAEQLAIPNAGFLPEATNTLINWATDTGPQLSVDLGATATNFTCTVEFRGTAPTSVLVYLEGSTYQAVYPAIWSQTVTYADIHSWEFHVTDKAVRYIRGNYVSKVGGDTTTAIRMICTAVQR